MELSRPVVAQHHGHLTLTLDFQGQFCISGIGGPIDMERRGCESTERWIHVVTFNFDLTHDLDLEFSTSNFEIALSQEWEGRSTWNERDMSRWDVIPTM